MSSSRFLRRLADALPAPSWAALTRGNLHAVVPGAVYRAAQPSPRRLARWIDELGLRAVLCLRGERPNRSWFAGERATCARAGVELHCLALRPRVRPSPGRLVHLAILLRDLPRPLLVHCRAGAERAGLAAAIVLLLDGRPVRDARGQFGPRYGFPVPRARTALVGVIDDYAHALDRQGRAPHPAGFFRWLREGALA